MGADYSYTQPSSSTASLDMTSLLEAEGQLYMDEAQSRDPPVVYADEADDGMPTSCYCGNVPEIGTSYTPKDPGRLYYTCANVKDGDCHIWKWWDVAVTEELSDVQTQLRLVKAQGFELHEKLEKLQKVVLKTTENARDTKTFAKVVCVLLSALFFVGLAVMFQYGRGSKD